MARRRNQYYYRHILIEGQWKGTVLSQAYLFVTEASSMAFYVQKFSILIWKHFVK